jgi:hypothetical protein
MPHGTRAVQIDFDFIDHLLRIRVSDGQEGTVRLRAAPLAQFYAEVMETLDHLGVPVPIWPHPVEVEAPIRFDRDVQHTAYEPEHANRFWRVLLGVDRALAAFRSGFLGKCSPVHFFWGSFDMAVTRFSGRVAPPHPGGIPSLADRVVHEAYSRECSSCGFWPGGGAIAEPSFYAYAYPEPPGYREHPILPEEAYYSDEMREHVLPYAAVRRASDPEAMLAEFFRSTYAAAADLGQWDRRLLERDFVPAA